MSDEISIDLRTYFTQSRDEFDDNFISIPYPPYFRVAESPAYGDDQLAASYAGINFELLGGQLQNRLAAIGSMSDRLTFPAPGQPDDFTARGDAGRFEYQGILSVDSENQATFGAEYENTFLNTHSIFDTTPVTRGHKEVVGTYAQWQSTLFSALTLTGGFRYDHDEEFGTHVSVKLAGAYQLNDGATILRANFGNGFKAPSLYELDSEYSNPLTALKPELGEGWEAGVDQSLFGGTTRLSLTWFDRHETDQIEFFDCFGPTSPACDLRYLVGGYYENIGRTRADGLEAEAAIALTDSLKADLGFTGMAAIDEATGHNLARVPDRTAEANVFWAPLHELSLGVGVAYVSHRFDDEADQVLLKSNLLLNLYASYALTDKLGLFGRIENVTNLRYEPLFGYGAQGQAFFAGIRATY